MYALQKRIKVLKSINPIFKHKYPTNKITNTFFFLGK